VRVGLLGYGDGRCLDSAHDDRVVVGIGTDRAQQPDQPVGSGDQR
jgi:hypothetical protein